MAKERVKDAPADGQTAQQAEVTKETGTVQMQKSGQKPKQESVYSVKELAANARGIFKTRPECVMAALKSAGKTEYTVLEAKEIVERFLKKEVR